MLNSFEIQNFKAFGPPQSMPFRPITLIFGPNSAGKSSLLHAFLFGKENLMSGESDIRSIRSNGEQIDLGGFKQFVYCQQLDRSVSWAAGIDVFGPEFSTLGDLNVRPESIVLKVENRVSTSTVSRNGGEYAVNLTLTVNGAPLFQSGNYRPNSDEQLPTQNIKADHPWLTSVAGAGAAAIAAASGIGGIGVGAAGLSTALFGGLAVLPILAPVVAGAGAIYGIRKFLNKAPKPRELSAQEKITGRLLSICIDGAATFGHTAYIGPLRTYPERPTYFHEHDTTANSPNREDAWWQVVMREDVRAKVNNWIGREGPLQTPYRIDSGSDATSNSIRITDLRTGASVTPRDIGVGMSQIMPILVHALCDTRKVVLVEQPEVHLHPQLQAELADVFIAGASQERQNHFVLETHSEAMILRFLRRIRETTLKKRSDLPQFSNEDLALIYVHPSEGGATLKEIRVDEFGHLMDDVPGGFFEETTWEMF